MMLIWAVQDYLGSSWTIWDYLWSFGTMLDQFGPFKIILSNKITSNISSPYLEHNTPSLKTVPLTDLLRRDWTARLEEEPGVPGNQAVLLLPSLFRSMVSGLQEDPEWLQVNIEGRKWREPTWSPGWPWRGAHHQWLGHARQVRSRSRPGEVCTQPADHDLPQSAANMTNFFEDRSFCFCFTALCTTL